MPRFLPLFSLLLAAASLLQAEASEKLIILEPNEAFHLDAGSAPKSSAAKAQTSSSATKTARTDTAKKVPAYRRIGSDYRYFVQLSAGATMFNIDQEDTRGSITLDREPDDSALTLGVDAGYFFFEHLYAGLHLFRSSYDDADVDHLMVSINYRFRQADLMHPYIGLIGGMGRFKWRKNPIDSNVNDPEGYNYYNGIQVGMEYALGGTLSLDVVYRYLLSEYTTELETFAADSTLTHDNEQQLSVGLRIGF